MGVTSFQENCCGGKRKVERNGEWSKRRAQQMYHGSKEDRGWKETGFSKGYHSQNYRALRSGSVFQRHFGRYRLSTSFRLSGIESELHPVASHCVLPDTCESADPSELSQLDCPSMNSDTVPSVPLEEPAISHTQEKRSPLMTSMKCTLKSLERKM